MQHYYLFGGRFFLVLIDLVILPLLLKVIEMFHETLTIQYSDDF